MAANTNLETTIAQGGDTETSSEAVEGDKVQTDTSASLTDPITLSQIALRSTSEGAKKEAIEFLESPDLVSNIINDIQRLGVAGESSLALGIYMIGVSRLLPKPLAGLVMGSSSSGKSYIISMVAKLFPEEAILQAHIMSPKGLVYMEPGSLVHRFIVAGERSRKTHGDAAESTRVWRELFSDGRVNSASCFPDKSGSYKTTPICQEGPISYVESTTLSIEVVFSEDRTRLLLFRADEGREQTRAIIESAIREAENPGIETDTKAIVERHHTLQRLLRSLPVKIPYAHQFRDSMPTNTVVTRRAFGQLISLIRASALLHQFQREVDGGCVVASVEDYDIVRTHFDKVLSRSLGCLSSKETERIDEIIDIVRKFEHPVFCVKMIAAKATFSENTVRNYVNKMVDAGLVAVKIKARSNRPATYMLQKLPSGHLDLPEISMDIPPSGIAI